MPASNEIFTPDTVDEQIDKIVNIAGSTSLDQFSPDTRLVQHLRYFYEMESADADAASLARVAQRLERAGKEAPTTALAGEEEQDQLVPALVEQGMLRSFPAKPARKRKFQHALSMIAAVAMLTLLVGSMVAVFTLARTDRNGISTGPDENSAYIFDGVLYKVDLAHQSVDWSIRIALTGFVAAEQQPVSNGIVYVSGIDGFSRNNSQDYVYAFRANHGSLAWRTQLSPLSRPVEYAGIYPLFPKALPATVIGFVTQPIVANGLVFVMSGNGQIFVLDAATGKLLREYLLDNTGAMAANLVAGAHGVIYATRGNQIIAINTITNRALWVKSIDPSQSIHAAALDGGTLYVASDSLPVRGSGSFTGYIAAFDAVTGQLRWRTPVRQRGSIQVNALNSLVVADGKVYTAVQNNNATSSVLAFGAKEACSPGSASLTFLCPSSSSPVPTS